VLDGFGIQESFNNMPTFSRLWNNYPHSVLQASGEGVGLEKDQVSNCKIGHLLLGSGRIIPQYKDIANDFYNEGYKENGVFQEILNHKNSRVHLIITLSNSKLNSNVEDLFRVYSILANNGFEQIYFHLIVETSIKEEIDRITSELKTRGHGVLSTIVGASQTQKYSSLVCDGKGLKILDLSKLLATYEDNKQDVNSLRPIVINDKGLIEENDIVIYLNYDEPMNLSKPVRLCSLFSKNYFAFLESPTYENTLGSYLTELALTQSRLAVGSKKEYITYDFDGFRKIKAADIKIAKDDDGTTPNGQSVVEITKGIINAMENDTDFILANIETEGTTKRLALIDKCLELILKSAEDNFYRVIICSDHGNKNTITYKDEKIIDKVPFIILDNKVELEEEGTICSVAPTILQYMEIALPEEMQETPVLIK
jgi:2,3-bisphosphoglycerate-independent phosphoglycerate mutase